MNNRNYDKEMQEIMEMHRERSERKTLLLHACCAPCASTCLTRLMQDFAVTVFYYNPNITDRDEYAKRCAELGRLIRLMNEEYAGDISLIEGVFEPEVFFEKTKGMEAVAEGGERCFLCYELRLLKTAELAAAKDFSYFATTLTLSPLKDARVINAVGENAAEKYPGGAAYLATDFKKNGGYQKSIELSREYGLYRQNYCGCIFSKR